MDAYATLISQLPEFINTREGAEALSELETMNGDPDWEMDADEIEALESVRALRDALDADWDSLTQYGGTLIHENHFTDYMRDVCRITAGSDNTLWNYVDWDRYADDARVNFTEVEVTSGEFEGTWLYRA